MLRAEVLQAHLLPRSVADILVETTSVGCSGSGGATHGWALHRSTLLLWRVADGLHAPVRRLLLPSPPRCGAFVEVLPRSGSAAVTVLVCSGDGELHAWLDASFPAPPVSQRLFAAASDDGGDAASDDERPITVALTAATADGGDTLGFVAVAATRDGALHLFHGSSAGLFPRCFHRPASLPPASTGAHARGSSGGVGMLGALGSVVKSLYNEAFDPLRGVSRGGPSTAPALSLLLSGLDAGRWRLLVLTADALDCWLLGGPGGGEAQLSWALSLAGVLGTGLGTRELTPVAVALAPGHSCPPRGSSGGGAAATVPVAGLAPPTGMLVYVWSVHSSTTSLARQHALSWLGLEEGGGMAPRYLGSALLPAATVALMPEPHDASVGGTPATRPWRVLPHVSLPSTLLLSPNGVILEWHRSEGEPRALGAGTENLAAACGGEPAVPGGPPSWQLLNAAYGLLEIAPAAAAGEPTPSTHDGSAHAAALALLGKTVSLMYKEASAGGPYRDLAEGLGDRLARLGMFDTPDAVQHLLLAASGGIVDAMPKAGLSGAASSASLRAALEEKQARHDLLLAACATGGVLQRTQPTVTTALCEHAEMLAAAAAVLAWQRQLEAAAGDADAAAAQAAAGCPTVTPVQASAAGMAIEDAGTLAAEGAAAVDAGCRWQLAFSRPTASMRALFVAVRAHATAVRAGDDGDESDQDGGGTASALQRLLGLAGVLRAALQGARAKGAELAGSVEFSSAAGDMGWLAGEEQRAAWRELAQASLQLRARLQEPEQRVSLAAHAHLPALLALLDCLRDAPHGDGTATAVNLRAERTQLPGEHGDALLADAREQLAGLSSSGVLAAATGSQAAPLPLQRALVWPLEGLAAAHHCHALLYDVCELLLAVGLCDEGRLHGHMRQSLADAETSDQQLPPDCFAAYVMERLRTGGHAAALLRLGREGFAPQLRCFLADHPALLWMAQTQAGLLPDAARSLAAAAQRESDSLSSSRRLLCLSRLASRAAAKPGGPPPTDAPRLAAVATARLLQLTLQERLELGGEPPLTAPQLALAALEAAEAAGAAGAAVAAVEALSLVPGGPSRAPQDADLWSRAWAAALNCTPLTELMATRDAARDGAASAEAYEQALRSSALHCAVLSAARALTLVDAAQPGEAPGTVLDAAARILDERVRSEQPAAAAVLADLLQSAAAAAAPLLEAPA